MSKTARASDKWIPWYFVGFFVVLAIIDGIFVTLATSTHRGVITEHAYQKGLNYNQTVAAEESQQKLGWQSKISFDDATQMLSFQLWNQKKDPISGAKVVVHLLRPTQEGYDFTAVLEEKENGAYSAPITFPLLGQWETKVSVVWQKHQYQQRKRIVVQ